MPRDEVLHEVRAWIAKAESDLRTHDLSELVVLLPDGSSVPNAVGDLTELTDAAVAVRYPDDYVDYGREEAEDLVDAAKTVKEAVLNDLRASGFAS